MGSPSAKLSAVKRALLAQQIRARSRGDEILKSEPIAIVGIGCRFPGGANNAQQLWRLLVGGVDAITEVPESRWSLRDYYAADGDAPGKMNTRWGGFLEDIDGFDADFFGISPVEAEVLDPQQRLLLEVAYEAIEDAGQVVRGTRTGVFIGISTTDYSWLQLERKQPIGPYTSTGFSHSIAANRLSYALDLRGPSVAVDTACSSSLLAVHLACQSLRQGESDMALAGGVNLMLSPVLSISFSKFGMMAPDGRCKTFDARANGFVRGEGCGVVALKRLSDALAQRDDIVALIRGSATNQDGRSNGLTAPSVLAQREVIRAALDNACVDPSQIGYIEAHGTGTALGDPIEIDAIKQIYGASAARPAP